MDTFIPNEYEVVRNAEYCIGCRVCERQCANSVHKFDNDLGKMIADSSKCVKLSQVRLSVSYARNKNRQVG